jgi:hypothetical protein
VAETQAEALQRDKETDQEIERLLLVPGSTNFSIPEPLNFLNSDQLPKQTFQDSERKPEEENE